jgi:hypothetical protein
MRTIHLFLFLLCSVTCFAQNFSGSVLDSKSKTGVPYVNIGIPAKAFGIISDGDGNFALKITTEKDSDIIQVSCIGYQPTYLNVKQFKANCENKIPIYLNEAVYELETTTVRPNDYETKVMGAKNVADLECMVFNKIAVNDTSYQRIAKEKGISDKAIGIEIGNKIKIDKGQQTFIDKIYFKTCVDGKDTCIYRVNVYAEGKTVDRKFTPVGVIKIINSTNILKEPIIVTAIGKTEVHEIDLSKQNIEVTDDFMIALECIYSSNKQMSIGADASVFGSTDLLIRPSIMGEWIKIPVMDVTFISASVTYKKKKGFWSRLFS